MPALAPVIRTVLPVWSGMSAVVHRAGMRGSQAWDGMERCRTDFAWPAERGCHGATVDDLAAATRPSRIPYRSPLARTRLVAGQTRRPTPAGLGAARSRPG